MRTLEELKALAETVLPLQNGHRVLTHEELDWLVTEMGNSTDNYSALLRRTEAAEAAEHRLLHQNTQLREGLALFAQIGEDMRDWDKPRTTTVALVPCGQYQQTLTKADFLHAADAFRGSPETTEEGPGETERAPDTPCFSNVLEEYLEHRELGPAERSCYPGTIYYEQLEELRAQLDALVHGR